MQQPMRVLQHQQISPEAAQLAGMYQLGAPQSEYRVRFRKATIVFIILAFLLGALFIGTAFAGGDSSALVIFILFALLFIAGGLYLALTPVIYRSWRVYVCTDGFVFKRGSRIDGFRWDQIESMWQAVTRRYTNGIYTGTTHKYTVRSKDGVQVVLNDRFANVEQLGNAISQAITNLLLPQVINAYKAGQTIAFGPLSISLQGVSNGKELVPWSQIKEMGVKQGIVRVRKEGQWLSWSTIRASQVPNIFVFMALVNYILKNRQ